LVISSSSITRLSASLASTAANLIDPDSPGLAAGARSPFDIERLLSLPLAALVAGDDELPHLLAELPVAAEARSRRAVCENLLHLRVDVERLPPRDSRSERAWIIWRISSSRTSGETSSTGAPVLRGMS
jgi:hypothetical protein